MARKMPIPRLPTQEELNELASYSEMELEEVQDYGYIAVFDHYCTDSPGYFGKVMVVVWSSGPSIHQVFIWDHVQGFHPLKKDENLL